VASIANDPGGRKRILFVDPKGDRKAIRLGKVSTRSAEFIKYRVEQLLESLRLKRPMEAELTEWVVDLDSALAEKLAAVGLIPKASGNNATLGVFLAEYTARRIDVKPATQEVWRQIVRNLLAHFGAKKELASITEGDAEDFKLYLIGEKLASTTVHKRLQFARMFFRDAKKRKLVPLNPFAEVSAKAVMKPDRQRYITVAEAERLLAVCNPTWRVIVALCRFGGLRCPSEVLSLRWDDIDWHTGRIIVQSPKTEHHPGKSCRTIPLFAELRPILTDAREIAPEGAEYVVGGDYRAAANSPSGWRNCNLRTQFERLVKRAGLQPWPRLFHAMRASRETELAKQYPIHVVTAWLGNTPRIALKHYLQTTNEDFDKAIGESKKGGAESGAPVAQKQAQQVSAVIGRESPETAQAPVETEACATFCDPYLITAKGLSGEDRIRTCGPVTRSRI